MGKSELVCFFAGSTAESSRWYLCTQKRLHAAFETVQIFIDWDEWPFLVLLWKIIKCFLFRCLSLQGDWWCDVLGFVAYVECFKLLNTSALPRCKLLVMAALLEVGVCHLGQSTIQDLWPDHSLVQQMLCFPVSWIQSKLMKWGQATAAVEGVAVFCVLRILWFIAPSGLTPGQPCLFHQGNAVGLFPVHVIPPMPVPPGHCCWPVSCSCNTTHRLATQLSMWSVCNRMLNRCLE